MHWQLAVTIKTITVRRLQQRTSCSVTISFTPVRYRSPPNIEGRPKFRRRVSAEARWLPNLNSIFQTACWRSRKAVESSFSRAKQTTGNTHKQEGKQRDGQVWQACLQPVKHRYAPQTSGKNNRRTGWTGFFQKKVTLLKENKKNFKKIF